MKSILKSFPGNTIAALMSAGMFTLSTAAYAGQCPEGAQTTDARTSGETEASGVVDTELSAVDLEKEIKGLKDRRLRLRQLSVAPGGVVPWHSHVDRPALIMVIVGAMTEYRSNCAEPIEHQAGDVSNEAGGISHWWRNNGEVTAVLIAADVKHD